MLPRRSLLALSALLLCAAPPLRAAGPDAGTRLPDPWKTLAPGVQSAAVAALGGDRGWEARVVLVDPRKARLSVQFDPSRPTLPQWRSRFPEALAIANGSFFSTDGQHGEVRPTCDVVLAGKPMRGAGCRRQDALFFGAEPAPLLPSAMVPAHPSAKDSASPACPAAPEGWPRLLSPQDFRPTDWAEAFKSFPALVHRCAASCTGPHYCRERSRTAALAQLRDGKLVLFASQWPAVREEVGRFLAETLGAAEAVNLDGGPEATLALRGEAPEDSIGTAGLGLPLVLVVLPQKPPAPPASR